MTERRNQDSVNVALAKLQDSLNIRLGTLTDAASPTAVHETRILIRRLRAALRALKHLFAPATCKHYLSALRRFALDLEAIREADARELVVNDLIVRSAFVHREQISQLLAVVAEQRVQSRRDLKHLMQTATWKRRLAELEQFGREHPVIASADTASILLRDALARRHRRLRRALRHIGRKPRKLHRLRLRVKDTRYLDEDFGLLLPEIHEQSVERLRRLQSRLGEFHDNWSLRKWIRSQYARQPIAKHLCAIVDARQAQLLKNIGRLGKSIRKKDKSIAFAA